MVKTNILFNEIPNSSRIVMIKIFQKLNEDDVQCKLVVCQDFDSSNNDSLI